MPRSSTDAAPAQPPAAASHGSHSVVLISRGGEERRRPSRPPPGPGLAPVIRMPLTKSSAPVAPAFRRPRHALQPLTASSRKTPVPAPTCSPSPAAGGLPELRDDEAAVGAAAHPALGQNTEGRGAQALREGGIHLVDHGAEHRQRRAIPARRKVIRLQIIGPGGEREGAPLRRLRQMKHRRLRRRRPRQCDAGRQSVGRKILAEGGEQAHAQAESVGGDGRVVGGASGARPTRGDVEGDMPHHDQIGRGAGHAAQSMVRPPDTERVCPVTKPDSSEARKTTAGARSSAVPRRPKGIHSLRLSASLGCRPPPPGRAVCPTARAHAVHVEAVRAVSRAMVLGKAMTPPLAAE